MNDGSCVALSLIRASVSVVNNFIYPETVIDLGGVPRVWRAGSLNLLSSAENQTRNFIASCGAVIRICVGQSLKVSSYCRLGVFVRDASIGGSQQDWEFLFEKRFPTRRP